MHAVLAICLWATVLVYNILLLLSLLLLQLPLQRTNGHDKLGMTHGHVRLRPQVGWQATGEQGSTRRFI